MTYIAETYAYEGQPPEEWPRWLIARNYARSRDGSLLIIHLFLHRLEIRPGQVIGLTSTQEIVIAA